MKNKIGKSINDKLTDPVFMKSIIETVMDPKNPDSGKLKKEILKNISNCIQKDDVFLTTIKGIVLENAENITKDIVTKTINGSSEYLTNALVASINVMCQDYFEEKKIGITNIINKTVNDCVSDIIQSYENNIDACKDKVESAKTPDVDIPNELKDDVLKYIEFLKFNKK